ncbi:MAG: hypothetical protein E6Q59_10915 [Nitrosomonas sp.]|uniref:hypothetical protein n=1 Tax=unclassified Nitrosomonas TaxID=2609265 RepID=UPI0011D3002F|nr:MULTISPECIES: hypothetical protein [unclassified Nitrosomonas]MDV6341857.1 hypothetical protein [Nitrosomonas sp. Is24]MDV6346899.1 hypothetical protein [Nitrosomonas sp. Is35]TXI35503.1 MAG: hypothetical protein E6Q59_10915 [Nitrosomonas sp.]
MEFSIVTFLLIMAAMALADVCWTLYFIDVEERRAHPAAFWSAMIILVTAFTVTNYVENKIYIAAAFLGAYCGTYVTIRWKLKKENEMKQKSLVE